MTYTPADLAAETLTGDEPRHEQLAILMARFHELLDENQARFLFDVRASGLHTDDEIDQMAAFHDGKRSDWCATFRRQCVDFLDARSPQ